MSCSSHLFAFVNWINTTLCHLLCHILSNRISPVPYFVDQILLLLRKCYWLDTCGVVPVQEEDSCVYTYSSADYLDLVKEPGERLGSPSAINLQAISHFIWLFYTFRTALLEKAFQILVTFIACAHAACISSLSMDFQYLFYILIVFTIKLLFYHHLKQQDINFILS